LPGNGDVMVRPYTAPSDDGGGSDAVEIQRNPSARIIALRGCIFPAVSINKVQKV
jgi:hypothetical protein